MSEHEPGPVEAAALADIAALGSLHGVQATLAAAAVTLARRVDARPSSDMARELRMMMKELWHLRHFGVSETPQGPAEVDRVDEVAARRSKRLEEGTPT